MEEFPDFAEIEAEVELEEAVILLEMVEVLDTYSPEEMLALEAQSYTFTAESEEDTAPVPEPTATANQVQHHHTEVEAQVEKAEDINEDLELILAKLREQKGLPPAPAYVAKTEEAAEAAEEEEADDEKPMYLGLSTP